MRRVLKYQLGMATTLLLPKGAEFLSVQLQDSQAVAWFLCDRTQREGPRKFLLIGTGHGVSNDFKYLGTFQSGPLVWHLFEDEERKL